MNTTVMSQKTAKVRRIEVREERLLWLTYGFYIVGVLIPLGVAINLLEIWRYRRATSLNREGMVIAERHHRWLLTTALTIFVATLIAMGTFYYVVGAVVAIATVVWWIYRVVRGMLALSHHTVPAGTE